MLNGRVTTNKVVERTRTEALDELPQFVNVLFEVVIDEILEQKHSAFQKEVASLKCSSVLNSSSFQIIRRIIGELSGNSADF